MALLEARPYRPFKSSEEYLEAMKEDLAEWLSTLYPELMINAENFMDRLDTGVALCKHANFVREAAEEYLARRQARNKSMTRSMTSGLAGPILAMGNVHYLPAAKSGTFFARDNVSNFITWCRKSLKIIECLLFETDDLIMRKNEKHVILCLLEVARRGAKFGMLAPMLVQMERQIDREIAADNKANGIGCGTQTDSNATQTDIGVGTESVATETDIFDTDSDNDDEDDDGPMLMYGPQPQIITNDLKSLDEMVRDLVEKCTCPSQFPMVRVSEGKYRIGDTKVLIFVRILRSHVMVRVGGGWDTLSHYLDKHDPCRCRAQHRSAIAARLIPRITNNQSNGIELHKAQVIFERSPPTARKIISNFNNQAAQHVSTNFHTIPNASPNNSNGGPNNNNISTINSLSPSFGLNKNRSRSPTPQRKFQNQQQQQQQQLQQQPNNVSIDTANVLTSPKLSRRSMSPSPRRLMDMRKKQSSLDSANSQCGPKSLPLVVNDIHVQFESLNSSQSDASTSNATVSNSTTNSESNTNGSKFENISDNGSEISDEGYRSLGLIQSNAQKRESLHSQTSTEDAEANVRLDPTSSDSQLSPTTDEAIASNKTLEHLDVEFEGVASETTVDAGPQSLPAVLSTPSTSPIEAVSNKFEQSGIFITDDDITVDIASATGLRRTGFSNKILGGTEATTKRSTAEPSKIPRSPIATRRRRSVDNSSSGSLQDLSTRTGLPVFNRQKPVYRSVRQPGLTQQTTKPNPASAKTALPASNVARKPKTQPARDITTAAASKKRIGVSSETLSPQRTSNGIAAASVSTTNNCSNFERNNRARASQVVYDSNGRRVKGCTASLTTSPVKHHATSPLAQQLLEAASSAKNDAQILEKMKTLLSRYAMGNQQSLQSNSKTNAPTASSNKKPEIYEDFTSAWVHSNGNLERSSSCSPPTKALSKRSSAASSTDSTNSRDIASVIISPRRERGVSKIPAPVVRRNTELY